MAREEGEYGSLNPGASPELARFAFLVGAWHCAARLKRDDGSWELLDASWVGRFTLDGYAIMDEFRMTKQSGELLVLGVNMRTYDVKKGTWNIKWLNALDGSWIDLVSPEYGGLMTDGRSISYTFPEPTGAHALTRATYTVISPGRFTWQGERSDVGDTWEEFLLIECHRDN